MTELSYVPTGPSDLRAIAVLHDVEQVSDRVLLVGAWMTRIWLLALKRPESIRRTNDVDIAIGPEVPSTVPLSEGLRRLGYARDPDYTFRYQRMTDQGLLIVDLLVDEERRADVPDAYPVYGLDTALRSTVTFRLSVVNRENPLEVGVPTLARAVLLRALALEQGPDGLKFSDYSADLAALATSMTDESAAELTQLRLLREFARAREIAAPLFASTDSPGPRAVAQRSRSDPEVAAQRASQAVLAFFGG